MTNTEKFEQLTKEIDALHEFFGDRAEIKCESDEMIECNKHIVMFGSIDEVTVNNKNEVCVTYYTSYNGCGDDYTSVYLTEEEANCSDEEFIILMEQFKVSSKLQKEQEEEKLKEIAKNNAIAEIERIRALHNIQ